MAYPIPSAVPELVPLTEPSKDQEDVKTQLVGKEKFPRLETQIDVEPAEESEVSILEELTAVTHLNIARQFNVKGALFLKGKKNKYIVKTPDSNTVYTIEEENSGILASYFCYGLRPFELKVVNGLGTEVIRINRPFACTTRMMPFQMQRLQVFSPPGRLIGNIEQHWTFLKPAYAVNNAAGDTVFWIRGPCFAISFFTDLEFHFMKPDGTHVGASLKRWKGICHALFVGALHDTFSIAFESDLNPDEKALLLAASLLLDYMYYDL